MYKARYGPYLIAPADFIEVGVPYGAFCKCGRCGIVERSTISFDFYTKENGESFSCETCEFGTPHFLVKPLLDKLEANGEFE